MISNAHVVAIEEYEKKYGTDVYDACYEFLDAFGTMTWRIDLNAAGTDWYERTDW